MSNIDDFDGDSCDCCRFEHGDWVESRLNANITGIVVGEIDGGHIYNVQLAGSLAIHQFHGVTLRHSVDPEDFGPIGGGGGESAPLDDNVIDFTKARDLRKTTTTRGAA